MNLIELNRSLVQLRLSGMAAVMETRLLQAQSENMAPIDLISALVSDELACRSKRLLERRHKQAQFRDADKRLDNFDFQFNARMNRNLVFELATANWIGKREDALFIGPPGSGKSHCAQAIGHAVIQQGYRVLYREAHRLLEELADAALDGKRKELMEQLTTVPLLKSTDCKTTVLRHANSDLLSPRQSPGEEYPFSGTPAEALTRGPQEFGSDRLPGCRKHPL